MSLKYWRHGSYGVVELPFTPSLDPDVQEWLDQHGVEFGQWPIPRPQLLVLDDRGRQVSYLQTRQCIAMRSPRYNCPVETCCPIWKDVQLEARAAPPPADPIPLNPGAMYWRAYVHPSFQATVVMPADVLVVRVHCVQDSFQIRRWDQSTVPANALGGVSL